MLKKLITISITAIASLQAATTYDKSLTDGNDDLNYWSDTTNSSLTNHTLVGATEVFTIGSRKNIPNVPTSSIKVSTNKLCSDDRKGLVSCSKSDSLEPRYTDDGLATTGEANLRTWYKATTPKSVNGVVDDPCPSLSNVGSVVNWWTDYSNLRCERTITTYTPKVTSYYSYSPRRVLYWGGWEMFGLFYSGYCVDFKYGWRWNEGQGAAVYCVLHHLDCPSGGSLSGSSCVIATQLCPDASWTDNGTNCKKNVPEYKLFPTF